MSRQYSLFLRTSIRSYSLLLYFPLYFLVIYTYRESYQYVFELLFNEGSEIERLTDEEANELIRECKPIYPKVRNSKTDKGE